MDIVEEIKNRIDIVDFINTYVPLKRAGQNYKALCPFHAEKTPSFMVNRERRSWHCFGCGEGGDVISFVEKIHNLSFVEALKLLAEQAGIPFQLLGSSQERAKKTLLYEILEAATHFFQEELFLKENQAVRDYLKERGLDKETVLKFRLGYASPSWGKLLRFLLKKGFLEKDLLVAGVVFKRKQGVIDLFRNRIIFPIFDLLGKPVAFSGRIFGKGEPKYLNSPETPIFKKSQTLFGLYHSKEAIREKGYAILVEGNFDLLVAYRFGTKNLIAPCGTAVTEDQLQLLARYTNSLAIAFDGDSAGQKAAFRAAILAARADLSPRIVELPENKDPADIVKENINLWQTALAERQPAVFYFLKKLLKKFSLELPEDKKRLVEELKPLVIAISNEIEQKETIIQLSEKLQIAPEILEKIFKENKTDKKIYLMPRQKSALAPIQILLGLLYRFELPVPKPSPLLSESQDKSLQFLAELASLKVGESLSWQDYLLKAKRGIVERFNELAQVVEEMYPEISREAAAEEVGRILKTIESRQKELRQKILVEKIKEAEKLGDKEKTKELLKELINLSH